MATDIVKPVGVVFMVNGVPYVTMFEDGQEMEVDYGVRVTMAIDGLTTEPWAGVDNMAGMLPLSTITAPRPPKFANEEEAAAWLDEYPVDA